jgi:hypothetical protein
VAPTVSSSTRRGSGTAQAGDEHRKNARRGAKARGERGGENTKKNKKNKADERHYANARKKQKKQSQTILK